MPYYERGMRLGKFASAPGVALKRRESEFPPTGHTTGPERSAIVPFRFFAILFFAIEDLSGQWTGVLTARGAAPKRRESEFPPTKSGQWSGGQWNRVPTEEQGSGIAEERLTASGAQASGIGVPSYKERLGV